MPRQREVVLGVDSSTQSTKVVAIHLETGDVLAEGRAPHTGANTQHPEDWWSALRTAVQVCVTDELLVRGISIGAQQHGFVTLDASGEVVRPAPLWNNVDAAGDADRLNALADFPAIVGSRLVASFTIAKLAHMARLFPDDLARTSSICLPHDFVTYRLTGGLATDRSDVSGTGWWDAAAREHRRDLLALAAGDDFAGRVHLAEVLGPTDSAGTLTREAAAELDLPAGIPVGPGAGDNAAAALSIGATDSELVISLGTSGVAYAVSEHQTHDPSGEVAGFSDATGRFLPLGCTINCTRVVDHFAKLVGVSVAEALNIAETVEPGANGVLLVPFLDGERTPNLPLASGQLFGLRSTNLNRESLLRAAVEGVAASLAYARTALDRLDVRKSVVTLVGGGANHPAWQQAIADANDLPVQVRGGGEHVARGAALQIAAIVREEPLTDLIERWRPPVVASVEPRPGGRDAFRIEERRALLAAERERQPV